MDDIVFKTMLTSDTEDSREALRHLLSACTRREISKVQVTNNDLIPAHLDAKIPRLDVHVTFNDGEAADLEMQINKSGDDLRDRAAFYAAMLQATQSRKGHAYGEIKRVYQIFFLNCVLYPNSGKFPRRYFYMEEQEHDRLTDATEVIFYEMPKLERKVQDIAAGKIKINSLPEDEKWCIYFKYRHEGQTAELVKRLYRTEEGIMLAERAVAGIDRDYLRAVRKMGEIKNRMDHAQMKYDLRQEVREEVRQEIQEKVSREVQKKMLREVRKEMRQEVREEMRQEVRKEMRQENTLEIARKMKNAGRPLSEITEFTGLPVRAIKQL
ncbi:MAG: Rpn family recombination-promoting nuclease/putative transposase [Treponema sp.]|nr:Rpn family recombination-promoting nuclease/putative transposase [Treponema sp.]